MTRKNNEDKLLRSVALQNAKSIRKARRSAERRSEFYLAEGERLAHIGSWGFGPSGFFDYWSLEMFQIFGLDPAGKAPTLEEYLALVHPEDREFMAGTLKQMLGEGSGCDVKKRIVRPDGGLRYVRSVGVPFFEDGVFKGYLGTAMDVTEQEHLTQELQRREAYLAEAQRLSHTGSFGWNVSSDEVYWSEEAFRIAELDPTTRLTMRSIEQQRVHPDDRTVVQEALDRARRHGTDLDFEHRLLMPDSSIKYAHVVAHAMTNESGELEYVGAVTDISERKQAEEMRTAHARNVSLRGDVSLALASGETLKAVLGGCVEAIVRHTDAAFARIWTLARNEDVLDLQASAGMYTHLDGAHSRMPVGELKIGLIAREKKPHLTNDVVNDARISDKAWAKREGMVAFAGYPLIVEERVVGVMAMFSRRPLVSASLEALASVADLIAQGIDRKRAEAVLQERERELRQLIDVVPHNIFVFGADGRPLYANQGLLDYFGLTQEDVRASDFRARIYHPDDLDRIRSVREDAMSRGEGWEAEVRFLRKNGQYRWFLIRSNPLRDEQGRIVRWYSTGTDIEDLKQAEDALRRAQGELQREADRLKLLLELTKEAEARFRHMADTAPVMIWMSGVDKLCTFFNKGWLDFTGRALEQELGDGWAKGVHPEDLDRCLEVYINSFNARHDFTMEYRLQRNDGAYRWILDSGAPRFAPDGAFLGYIGSCMDVSGLKETEAALKERERELQELIDIVPHNILVFGTDGSPLYVNQGLREFFGFTLEEIQAPDFRARVYHPDDTDRVRSVREDAMSRGTPWEVEARILRKDGQYRWLLIRCNPLRDGQGNIVRWYSTGTDIEDLKRAEEALRASEQFSRLIVDSIPDFACTMTAEGEVEFVNRRILDYTGWTLEELKNWARLVHPEDLALVLASWKHSVETGDPYDLEERIRGADGTYRWFNARGLPRRDAEGRITRWYLLLSDIEDLKRTEDTLRRTQVELEHEADRLKLLLDLTNSMISKVELRDLLRAIASSIRRVMQCEAVSVRLPDAERNKLRVYALDFPESKGLLREETFIPIEGTLSGKVFRTGKPYVSDDLGTDAATSAGLAEGLKSGCFLPLIHRGRVLGVMGLGRRESSFSLEDVGFLAQVTGQVAIAIDNVLAIEERKRAEEALRKSEAYLAEAQRLSHTGSFGWSVSSGEIFWSEETFRIFEYDRAQAKPSVELVLQRVHTEDLALVQQTIHRVSHEAKDFDLEHRLLMPDGSIKHVHVVAHAVRNESAELEYVGAVMDVTERKRAEAVLRERERELRQLIDVGPQYMCVYGADESPLYASDGLLDYFGFTLQDFQADDFRTRVFHPDDLERVQVVREDAMHHGEGWEVECRILRKDGQYRWFLIRGKPLRDEEGHVVRWYSTGTDIEGLKRAEEALQQAQAELAHVTRVTMLGELAASIAHEINQPLSAIVTNGSACLRWLAADSPNLDEAREAARRVIRDGNRASEVITRIRALSRKAAIQKERLDVNEAIQEIVALAQGQIRRNAVALKVELAGDLPHVLGDRVQLQQVILNLIMNGIEAMSANAAPLRELAVSTQCSKDGQVLVAVRDSGVGFDPKNAERIFDAFYTTKPGGMGMGLSISRSIVENHGGRLWAVPNEGPGATFQFTLLKYS